VTSDINAGRAGSAASALGRLSKLCRKAARRGTRLVTTTVAFSSLGYWTNRVRFPLSIEHRPDSHYEFDRYPDYRALFQSWVKGNRINNAGDLARFYMLLQNCAQVFSEGIQGDIAELGVYKGNSAALFAHFARKNGRQLYLFDTFSGFDQRDFTGTDAKCKVVFTDTSLEGVTALVGKDAVTYVPGFFPDSTATIVMPTQLAIAHIDCDLHDPMKAALERFYPLMAPGGLIIMHDYTSGFWPGVAKAVDEFFADKPERPILIPDKSGSAVIRIARSGGRT
jgi:hypothetical protein